MGNGYSSGGPVNTIDYITIASTGNATDFGDMTNTYYGKGGTSNSTRGIFCGGNSPGSSENTIDYITIASAGNAADFGDLTAGRYLGSAASNAHGGLS
jgi:hypothetical protein